MHKLIMTLLLFVFFSQSHADILVNHSHNNRIHNHQLPKDGLLHRHGRGERGKAIKSQKRVIRRLSTKIPNQSTYKLPKENNQNSVRNNDSLHIHAKRKHQHPLPSVGVSHRHGSTGAIGQPVYRSNTINKNNIKRNYSTTRANSSSISISIKNTKNPNRSDKRKWKQAQGKNKYIKGSTTCSEGNKDCNVCAVNVQQQFQKAASKQINWSRKRWDFSWPQNYPPQNVRPLDIFDGDAKYALGIPDTHVQGFVRTNSRRFPYAGSHSHKKKGGIFVVRQDSSNKQSLSSLHKTSSRHPSGVQVIGKYLVYGEGSRLVFKDIESQNQSNNIRLRVTGANFGGGLGVFKLSRDNHLLVTTGPGGQKRGKRYNRFYHLKSINGRPDTVKFINQSLVSKPQQWPSAFNYSENMSLITECGTGDVYSIHTTGDEQGISAISGKGYWRLSKLVNSGKELGLKAINAFTTGQDMKRCNVRASATVSVNRRNRLEFLCHGYAKDPDGSGFNVLGKSSRTKDKFYFNVGVIR